MDWGFHLEFCLEVTSFSGGGSFLGSDLRARSSVFLRRGKGKAEAHNGLRDGEIDDEYDPHTDRLSPCFIIGFDLGSCSFSAARSQGGCSDGDYEAIVQASRMVRGEIPNNPRSGSTGARPSGCR